MTGLSDLSLVNLAFVSSNPPLSLFTLPSLACSSLSLRMRDTLLESDVGENTPEPRPRITPCRRNSLEDLFKWTYDYRGEREEKKKNTVFTQAVSTAFSPPCAGDISTLSCLNSHRQHAVRQHNPSTVPLLPSPEFHWLSLPLFLSPLHHFWIIFKQNENQSTWLKTSNLNQI